MRALIAWTVAALVVWSAYAQWLAPPAPAIPLAPVQNVIVAERLEERDAPVVLLGSSLTARLPLAVLDRDAMAVGISGGSAPDAIALARALRRRPRVAIIETNRLVLAPRLRDMAELADSARVRPRWRARRMEYRPSTQAIALIVRVTDALRAVVRIARPRWTAETGNLGSDALTDRAAAMRALAWTRGALDEWRAAGTLVLLVHLPTSVPTDSEAVTRTLVDEVFPTSLFPRITLDDGPWPTTDGRHLERDAARRAAAQILRAARDVRRAPAPRP
jgi:hypothetical protein